MHYRIFVLLFAILTSAKTSFALNTLPNADDTQSCSIGIDCENGRFGLSADEIALHAKPDVTPVRVDQSIVFDRLYRRVNGAVNIYDAPNGNTVGTLDSGFNFITLMSEQDGWAQIASDKWIRAESLTMDVPTSLFGGHSFA